MSGDPINCIARETLGATLDHLHEVQAGHSTPAAAAVAGALAGLGFARGAVGDDAAALAAAMLVGAVANRQDRARPVREPRP